MKESGVGLIGNQKLAADVTVAHRRLKSAAHVASCIMLSYHTSRHESHEC